MNRRTMMSGDPRHGTQTGYSAGCHLNCCRLAHNRYMKLYRHGWTAHHRPAVGTLRRIRALQAIGWSVKAIGAAGGVSRFTLNHILRSGGVDNVHTSTLHAVAVAYSALSMRPGPSRQLKTVAELKGWAPPLAWDDDSIDDPSAQPSLGHREGLRRRSYDWVIVERALAGQPVQATSDERADIIRRWAAAGRSLADLNRIQGWNSNRDLRHVQQARAVTRPPAGNGVAA